MKARKQDRWIGLVGQWEMTVLEDGRIWPRACSTQSQTA